MRGAEEGSPIGEVGENVILGLGVALERMSALAGHARPTALTSFHGVREPAMGIKEYVIRVRKFFRCTRECYVLALIFIDRVIKRHAHITVSILSSHRLLICAMTLAAKFQDDEFYTNSFYAKVGGIQLEEMNSLELKMLQLLDYKLFVTPAEFEVYRHILCKAEAAETADARRRGIVAP